MASRQQDGRSGLGDVLLVIRKIPFLPVQLQDCDRLIEGISLAC